MDVGARGILCASQFFDCSEQLRKIFGALDFTVHKTYRSFAPASTNAFASQKGFHPTFNQNKKDIRRCPFYFGGESGIRTHGCFHIAGFQDRCLQPTRPSLRMVRQLYYHKKICLSIVFFKTGILY